MTNKKMVKKEKDIKDVRKGILGSKVIPLADSFEENLAIIDAYADGARKSLLWMSWNIGRICTEMAEQEGKYGTNVVERVAEHIGKGKRIVFEMQKAFKTFNDESSIAELDSDGFGWTQVKLLSRVTDPEERDEIVKKVSRDNLNSSELEELVRKSSKPEGGEDSPPTAKSGEFNLMKYVEGVEKLVKETRASVKEAAKGLTTALGVMEHASDDAFYPAYEKAKTVARDVDSLVTSLVELKALSEAWDE